MEASRYVIFDLDDTLVHSNAVRVAFGIVADAFAIRRDVLTRTLDDLPGRPAREIFEASRRYGTGGTYLNFLTEEEGGPRIVDAYGETNLRKLGELKRTLDPANLFRHTKPVAAA